MLDYLGILLLKARKSARVATLFFSENTPNNLGYLQKNYSLSKNHPFGWFFDIEPSIRRVL